MDIANDIAVMVYLSPVIFITLFIVFSVIIFRLRKMLHAHAQVIVDLQENINAICSGAVGLGEHMQVLEDRCRLLMSQQEKFELHESPDRNYKYALRMVQNGAQIEEVIEDCGIAQGEAELVLLANRMDKLLT